jgi:hypothetical protein
MQVSGVQDSSIYTTSSSQQQAATTSSTSSFASHFSTAASSGDDIVQEFMKYASETPEQRMFDNWLSSQNVSEQQYDAMTPAQQQALIDKFEEQLKAHLQSQALTSLDSTTTA